LKIKTPAAATTKPETAGKPETTASKVETPPTKTEPKPASVPAVPTVKPETPAPASNTSANNTPAPSPESSLNKPPVKSQPVVVPAVPRNPDPSPVIVVQPTTAAPGTHIVEAGETFFAIAKKYNTTVSNLKKMNGFPESENALSVGQALKIR
ncbi:MAG: LysM domain, partial [Bacteroidota bacterium]|jgi:LysM repeat protein